MFTATCRAATAIVLLSVAGGVLFGQGSSQVPTRKVKITPVTSLPQQNIGFELPELPGEEFRIVIPELISYREEPILPWSTPSPKWEIGDNLARFLIEIPHEIRMETEVRFLGEEIRTTVRATNLSERSWQKANAFTCFAFYAAPLFDDSQLTRTLSLPKTPAGQPNLVRSIDPRRGRRVNRLSLISRGWGGNSAGLFSAPKGAPHG